MILDAFAKASNAVFTDKRYGEVTEVRVKNKILLLLKPSTYMNLSGNAIRYWMKSENIPLENVLVVVDDLALPFGSIRLKAKGSDAGHNGLKHIQSTFNTQNYARLRLGIGSEFERGNQVDYVLGNFSSDEIKDIEGDISSTCIEIIKSFCLAGVSITMNQFNKKKKE